MRSLGSQIPNKYPIRIARPKSSFGFIYCTTTKRVILPSSVVSRNA